MKHCFKCNAFRTLVGGGLCLTGNGRKRFICASCAPRVHNRLVVRYVAASTADEQPPEPTTPAPAVSMMAA